MQFYIGNNEYESAADWSKIKNLSDGKFIRKIMGYLWQKSELATRALAPEKSRKTVTGSLTPAKLNKVVGNYIIIILIVIKNKILILG